MILKKLFSSQPWTLFSVGQWHRSSIRPWKKGLALALCVTFIFPYLTWAFTPSNAAAATVVRVNQQPVTFPETAGTIVQSHVGNARVVLYIQDLHCNYEVQTNIARLVEYAAEHYGVQNVFVEGASGPINVARLAQHPLAWAKQEIAEYLLREGKITGPEMLAANGTHALRILGVENAEQYQSSLDLVQGFLNSEIQGYVQDLRDGLTGLKPTLYSPALLRLDQAKQAYREGKRSLLNYALDLVAWARAAGISLETFSAVATYTQHRQEPFGAGLSSDQLFRELEGLDQALREPLYQTAEQRRLDLLEHRLDVMERLLNISASTDDLAEWSRAPKEFSVAGFVAFIQAHMGEDEWSVDPEAAKLDETLIQVKAFYRLADQRSDVFAQAISAKMASAPAGVSVLIAGGYHSERVLAALKKSGCSYVSLVPKITRHDVANPYFDILRNRQTSLEKLLEKNQTILAPASRFPQTDKELSALDWAQQPKNVRLLDQTIQVLERLSEVVRTAEQNNAAATQWQELVSRRESWDEGATLVVELKNGLSAVLRKPGVSWSAHEEGERSVALTLKGWHVALMDRATLARLEPELRAAQAPKLSMATLLQWGARISSPVGGMVLQTPQGTLATAPFLRWLSNAQPGAWWMSLKTWMQTARAQQTVRAKANQPPSTVTASVVGRAFNTEAFEPLSVLGAVSLPLALYFFVPAATWPIFVVGAVYLLSLVIVPVATAHAVRRALRYTGLNWGPARVLFSQAEDIRTIQSYLENARGKISYYLFDEQTGRAGRLFVDRLALSHLNWFFRAVIWTHEMMHAKLGLRVEFVAVPMTMTLPWGIFGALLTGLSLWLDPSTVFFYASFTLYNLIGVPTLAAWMARQIGVRQNLGGHAGLQMSRWHPLSHPEVDAYLSAYAHEASRQGENSTEHMTYWRHWMRGDASSPSAVIIPCPNRAEDILLIKANQQPGDITALRQALGATPKKNLLVVLADNGSDPALLETAMRENATEKDRQALAQARAVRQARSERILADLNQVLQEERPGTRVLETQVRSTVYSLTRLTDLTAIYERRLQGLKHDHVTPMVVASEPHGHTVRLLKVVRWMRAQGMKRLVFLGDYLGKFTDAKRLAARPEEVVTGFEVVDELRQIMMDGDIQVSALMGKSEHIFLRALLGDENASRVWLSEIFEGKTVLRDLKKLAAEPITSKTSELHARDIRQAQEFERMFQQMIRAQGKMLSDVDMQNAWTQWFRFHPKLLDMAEFMVEHMRFVYFEDDWHNLYMVGGINPELDWRGLKGVGALQAMEREFRETAQRGLRLTRMMQDVWTIMERPVSEGTEAEMLRRTLKVLDVIEQERAINVRLGRELVPESMLKAMNQMLNARVISGRRATPEEMNAMFEQFFATLKKTAQPLPDVFKSSLENASRAESPFGSDHPGGLKGNELYARQAQRNELGINTIINPANFTDGVQELGQIHVTDRKGVHRYAVDTLDQASPKVEPLLAAQEANEAELTRQREQYMQTYEHRGLKPGEELSSLERVFKYKQQSVRQVLADYQDLVPVERSNGLVRTWKSVSYLVRAYMSELQRTGRAQSVLYSATGWKWPGLVGAVLESLGLGALAMWLQSIAGATVTLGGVSIVWAAPLFMGGALAAVAALEVALEFHRRQGGLRAATWQDAWGVFRARLLLWSPYWLLSGVMHAAHPGWFLGIWIAAGAAHLINDVRRIWTNVRQAATATPETALVPAGKTVADKNSVFISSEEMAMLLGMPVDGSVELPAARTLSVGSTPLLDRDTAVSMGEVVTPEERQALLEGFVETWQGPVVATVKVVENGREETIAVRSQQENADVGREWNALEKDAWLQAFARSLQDTHATVAWESLAEATENTRRELYLAALAAHPTETLRKYDQFMIHLPDLTDRSDELMHDFGNGLAGFGMLMMLDESIPGAVAARSAGEALTGLWSSRLNRILRDFRSDPKELRSTLTLRAAVLERAEDPYAQAMASRLRDALKGELKDGAKESLRQELLSVVYVQLSKAFADLEATYARLMVELTQDDMRSRLSDYELYVKLYLDSLLYKQALSLSSLFGVREPIKPLDLRLMYLTAAIKRDVVRSNKNVGDAISLSDIEVEIETPSPDFFREAHWVQGEPGRILYFLLKNVVTNAQRAVVRKAQSLPTAEQREYVQKAVVRVRFTAEGFTVEDAGDGITREMARRMFDRGVTEGMGTGLGLHSVLKLARQYGIQLTYDTEVGRGTTVRARFQPLSRAEVSEHYTKDLGTLQNYFQDALAPLTEEAALPVTQPVSEPIRTLADVERIFAQTSPEVWITPRIANAAPDRVVVTSVDELMPALERARAQGVLGNALVVAQVIETESRLNQVRQLILVDELDRLINSASQMRMGLGFLEHQGKVVLNLLVRFRGQGLVVDLERIALDPGFQNFGLGKAILKSVRQGLGTSFPGAELHVLARHPASQKMTMDLFQGEIDWEFYRNPVAKDLGTALQLLGITHPGRNERLSVEEMRGALTAAKAQDEQTHLTDAQYLWNKFNHWAARMSEDPEVYRQVQQTLRLSPMPAAFARAQDRTTFLFEQSIGLLAMKARIAEPVKAPTQVNSLLYLATGNKSLGVLGAALEGFGLTALVVWVQTSAWGAALMAGLGFSLAAPVTLILVIAVVSAAHVAVEFWRPLPGRAPPASWAEAAQSLVERWQAFAGYVLLAAVPLAVAPVWFASLAGAVIVLHVATDTLKLWPDAGWAQAWQGAWRRVESWLGSWRWSLQNPVQALHTAVPAGFAGAGLPLLGVRSPIVLMEANPDRERGLTGLSGGAFESRADYLRSQLLQDRIVDAMEALGGRATVEDIYKVVQRSRNVVATALARMDFKAINRVRIQQGKMPLYPVVHAKTKESQDLLIAGLEALGGIGTTVEIARFSGVDRREVLELMKRLDLGLINEIREAQNLFPLIWVRNASDIKPPSSRGLSTLSLFVQDLASEFTGRSGGRYVSLHQEHVLPWVLYAVNRWLPLTGDAESDLFNREDAALWLQRAGVREFERAYSASQKPGDRSAWLNTKAVNLYWRTIFPRAIQSISVGLLTLPFLDDKALDVESTYVVTQFERALQTAVLQQESETLKRLAETSLEFNPARRTALAEGAYHGLRSRAGDTQPYASLEQKDLEQLYAERPVASAEQTGARRTWPTLRETFSQLHPELVKSHLLEWQRTGQGLMPGEYLETSITPGTIKHIYYQGQQAFFSFKSLQGIGGKLDVVLLAETDPNHGLVVNAYAQHALAEGTAQPLATFKYSPSNSTFSRTAADIVRAYYHVGTLALLGRPHYARISNRGIVAFAASPDNYGPAQRVQMKVPEKQWQALGLGESDVVVHVERDANQGLIIVTDLAEDYAQGRTDRPLMVYKVGAPGEMAEQVDALSRLDVLAAKAGVWLPVVGRPLAMPFARVTVDGNEYGLVTLKWRGQSARFSFPLKDLPAEVGQHPVVLTVDRTPEEGQVIRLYAQTGEGPRVQRLLVKSESVALDEGAAAATQRTLAVQASAGKSLASWTRAEASVQALRARWAEVTSPASRRTLAPLLRGVEQLDASLREALVGWQTSATSASEETWELLLARLDELGGAVRRLELSTLNDQEVDLVQGAREHVRMYVKVVLALAHAPGTALSDAAQVRAGDLAGLAPESVRTLVRLDLILTKLRKIGTLQERLLARQSRMAISARASLAWAWVAGTLPMLAGWAYGAITGHELSLAWSNVAWLTTPGASVFLGASLLSWMSQVLGRRAGPYQPSHFLATALEDEHVAFFEVQDTVLKVQPAVKRLLTHLPVWLQNAVLYGTGVVGHESAHFSGHRTELYAYGVMQALPAAVGALLLGGALMLLGVTSSAVLVGAAVLGAFVSVGVVGRMVSTFAREDLHYVLSGVLAGPTQAPSQTEAERETEAQTPRMPAEYLVEVLDLKDIAKHPGIEILSVSTGKDYHVMSIRVPERLNPRAIPSGLEILQNEMGNIREFDLVSGMDGRLLAVFPAPSSIDQIGMFKGKDKNIPYFDLTPFYFRAPAVRAESMASQWSEFYTRMMAEQKILTHYKDARLALRAARTFAINSEKEQDPHAYIGVHALRGGKLEWYAQQGYMGRNLLSSLQAFNHVAETVLAVFPTVYSPAQTNHMAADSDYYINVFDKLGLSKGMDVLVVGPGSGTDTWLVAQKTQNTVHAAGLNPLEVANVRANANSAGFKVKAVVSNNIMDAHGKTIFPETKFDRIVWNMPNFIPEQARSSIPKELRLSDHWDLDIGGDIYRRFLAALPKMLKPDGYALIWNANIDEDTLRSIPGFWIRKVGQFTYVIQQTSGTVLPQDLGTPNGLAPLHDTARLLLQAMLKNVVLPDVPVTDELLSVMSLMAYQAESAREINAWKMLFKHPAIAEVAKTLALPVYRRFLEKQSDPKGTLDLLAAEKLDLLTQGLSQKLALNRGVIELGSYASARDFRVTEAVMVVHPEVGMFTPSVRDLLQRAQAFGYDVAGMKLFNGQFLREHPELHGVLKLDAESQLEPKAQTLAVILRQTHEDSATWDELHRYFIGEDANPRGNNMEGTIRKDAVTGEMTLPLWLNPKDETKLNARRRVADLSSQPLEAMQQVIRVFDVQPEQTTFGRLLKSAGYTPEQLAYLSENPALPAEPGSESKPLFASLSRLDPMEAAHQIAAWLPAKTLSTAAPTSARPSGTAVSQDEWMKTLQTALNQVSQSANRQYWDEHPAQTLHEFVRALSELGHSAPLRNWLTLAQNDYPAFVRAEGIMNVLLPTAQRIKKEPELWASLDFKQPDVMNLQAQLLQLEYVAPTQAGGATPASMASVNGIRSVADLEAFKNAVLALAEKIENGVPTQRSSTQVEEAIQKQLETIQSEERPTLEPENVASDAAKAPVRVEREYAGQKIITGDFSAQEETLRSELMQQLTQLGYALDQQEGLLFGFHEVYTNAWHARGRQVFEQEAGSLKALREDATRTEEEKRALIDRAMTQGKAETRVRVSWMFTPETAQMEIINNAEPTADQQERIARSYQSADEDIADMVLNLDTENVVLNDIQISGTGVGLGMARRMLRDAHGELTYRFRKGETAFRIAMNRDRTNGLASVVDRKLQATGWAQAHPFYYALYTIVGASVLEVAYSLPGLGPWLQRQLVKRGWAENVAPPSVSDLRAAMWIAAVMTVITTLTVGSGFGLLWSIPAVSFWAGISARFFSTAHEGRGEQAQAYLYRLGWLLTAAMFAPGVIYFGIAGFGLSWVVLGKTFLLGLGLNVGIHALNNTLALLGRARWLERALPGVARALSRLEIGSAAKASLVDDLIHRIAQANHNGQALQGIVLSEYPKQYGEYAVYYLIRDLKTKFNLMDEISPMTLPNRVQRIASLQGLKPQHLTVERFFVLKDTLAQAHAEGRLGELSSLAHLSDLMTAFYARLEKRGMNTEKIHLGQVTRLISSPTKLRELLQLEKMDAQLLAWNMPIVNMTSDEFGRLRDWLEGEYRAGKLGQYGSETGNGVVAFVDEISTPAHAFFDLRGINIRQMTSLLTSAKNVAELLGIDVKDPQLQDWKMPVIDLTWEHYTTLIRVMRKKHADGTLRTYGAEDGSGVIKLLEEIREGVSPLDILQNINIGQLTGLLNSPVKLAGMLKLAPNDPLLADWQMPEVDLTWDQYQAVQRILNEKYLQGDLALYGDADGQGLARLVMEISVTASPAYRALKGINLGQLTRLINSPKKVAGMLGTTESDAQLANWHLPTVKVNWTEYIGKYLTSGQRAQIQSGELGEWGKGQSTRLASVVDRKLQATGWAQAHPFYYALYTIVGASVLEVAYSLPGLGPWLQRQLVKRGWAENVAPPSVSDLRAAMWIAAVMTVITTLTVGSGFGLLWSIPAVSFWAGISARFFSTAHEGRGEQAQAYLYRLGWLLTAAMFAPGVIYFGIAGFGLSWVVLGKTFLLGLGLNAGIHALNNTLALLGRAGWMQRVLPGVARILLRLEVGSVNPTEENAEKETGLEKAETEGTPLSLPAEFSNWLKTLFPTQKTIVFADLGAGPKAEFGRNLRQRLGQAGFEVERGISVDHSMIERHVPSDLQVWNADLTRPEDLEAVGLRSEDVDLVTLNNIINNDLVAPALKLLAPGGVLMITHAATDVSDHPDFVANTRKQLETLLAGNPAYQILEVARPKDYPTSNVENKTSYASAETMLVVKKAGERSLSAATDTNHVPAKLVHALSKMMEAQPIFRRLDTFTRGVQEYSHQAVADLFFSEDPLVRGLTALVLAERLQAVPASAEATWVAQRIRMQLQHEPQWAAAQMQTTALLRLGVDLPKIIPAQRAWEPNQTPALQAVLQELVNMIKRDGYAANLERLVSLNNSFARNTWMTGSDIDELAIYYQNIPTEKIWEYQAWLSTQLMHLGTGVTQPELLFRRGTGTEALRAQNDPTQPGYVELYSPVLGWQLSHAPRAGYMEEVGKAAVREKLFQAWQTHTLSETEQFLIQRIHGFEATDMMVRQQDLALPQGVSEELKALEDKGFLKMSTSEAGRLQITPLWISAKPIPVSLHALQTAPAPAAQTSAASESAAQASAALTLEQAQKVLADFLGKENVLREDLEYSYTMAQELSKHPVQRALVVGMGLMNLPVLLALTGKDVVMVDADPNVFVQIRWMLKGLQADLQKKGPAPELKLKLIGGEIGTLDLKANGLEEHGFDAVTLVDLIGGIPNGKPRLWLEKARTLLRSEGLIVVDEHAGRETITEHFKRVFPNARPLAEGKPFRGAYEGVNSQNRIYAVSNAEVPTEVEALPDAQSSLLPADPRPVQAKLLHPGYVRYAQALYHVVKKTALPKGGIHVAGAFGADLARLMLSTNATEAVAMDHGYGLLKDEVVTKLNDPAYLQNRFRQDLDKDYGTKFTLGFAFWDALATQEAITGALAFELNAMGATKVKASRNAFGSVVLEFDWKHPEEPAAQHRTVTLMYGDITKPTEWPKEFDTLLAQHPIATYSHNAGMTLPTKYDNRAGNTNYMQELYKHLGQNGLMLTDDYAVYGQDTHRVAQDYSADLDRLGMQRLEVENFKAIRDEIHAIKLTKLGPANVGAEITVQSNYGWHQRIRQRTEASVDKFAPAAYDLVGMKLDLTKLSTETRQALLPAHWEAWVLGQTKKQPLGLEKLTVRTEPAPWWHVKSYTEPIYYDASAHALVFRGPWTRLSARQRVAGVRHALEQYQQARNAAWGDELPGDFQARRQHLAAVREKIQRGEPVTVAFVCMANQQRSFLGHILTEALAKKYGKPVTVISGGTGLVNLSELDEIDRAKMADIRPSKSLSDAAREMLPPEAHPAIEAFRSLYAVPELSEKADIIITATPMIENMLMENYQVDRLGSSYAAHAGKLVSLGLLSEKLYGLFGREVPDLEYWTVFDEHERVSQDPNVERQSAKNMIAEFLPAIEEGLFGNPTHLDTPSETPGSNQGTRGKREFNRSLLFKPTQWLQRIPFLWRGWMLLQTALVALRAPRLATSTVGTQDAKFEVQRLAVFSYSELEAELVNALKHPELVQVQPLSLKANGVWNYLKGMVVGHAVVDANGRMTFYVPTFVLATLANPDRLTAQGLDRYTWGRSLFQHMVHYQGTRLAAAERIAFVAGRRNVEPLTQEALRALNASVQGHARVWNRMQVIGQSGDQTVVVPLGLNRRTLLRYIDLWQNDREFRLDDKLKQLLPQRRQGIMDSV